MKFLERLGLQKIPDVDPELEELKNYYNQHYDEWRQTVIRIGNKPVTFTTNKFDSSRPDRMDSNLGACIKLIANRISTLPIKIQTKKRVDGKMTWVDDDEHEALKLFKKPNPYNTQTDLMTHQVQSLLITGRSFITKDVVFNAPPSALWFFPSWMFENLYSKTDGKPTGFMYDKWQKKIRYDIDEVIFTHFYDMGFAFDGVNPLSAIYDEIKSNFYAMQWHQAFFKNSATPDMLFTQGEFKGSSDEEDKKFLKSWAKRHQGYMKAHKAGILPAGMDVKVIEQKIADMMMNAMIELNREQILSFMLVYPAELGILKDASFANALMQDRAWLENNLIPFLLINDTSLNHQLIWPVWGDDTRVVHDLSDVLALQADKAVVYKAHRDAIEGGFETPNDARRDIGLEPLDEEGADELRQPGQNAMNVNLNNPDGKALPCGCGEKSESKADDDPPDPRRVKWQIFDEKATSFEPEFTEIMQKFFEAEEKRVLKNTRETTANGLLMDSFLYKVHISPSELKRGTDDELPDHVNEMFDVKAEDEALTAATKKPIEAAVASSGQAFMDSHQGDLKAPTVSATFNLKDPNVLAAIARQQNRIKYVNDDTYKKLRALLDTAYDEGWNIHQLESAIKDLYDKWITGDIVDKKKLQSRAKTVARTEMGTAVNGGDYLGQLQAGVKFHEWLATVDGATRPDHTFADGQKVAITEPFTVGGEKLLYPLDPAGSPGQTINCRCTTLEHFE